MRLGRQLNDASLPLDGSRRRIEGEDFDRRLIEDRYSHSRPFAVYPGWLHWRPQCSDCSQWLCSIELQHPVRS